MPDFIAITDPSDPRIAGYRDIRERDVVGRAGQFIAEGAVVLDVLLRARRHKILSVLIAERRRAALAERLAALPDHVPVYCAPDALIETVAGFAIHRGVLALGARGDPLMAEDALRTMAEDALVLVLMGIANHDNVGGIFRNAAAFGAGLVLLDGACCDPLYRKAIRVSVGGTLIVPFARLAPEDDVLALLSANGFAAVALSPSGAMALQDFPPSRRAVLLLGSEGKGLPAGILARAQSVRIDMAGGFDSLNVATASGIALHHFAIARRA